MCHAFLNRYLFFKIWLDGTDSIQFAFSFLALGKKIMKKDKTFSYWTGQMLTPNCGACKCFIYCTQHLFHVCVFLFYLYFLLVMQKAAIKKMDMQASKEFFAELKVLTHVHHLNLVMCSSFYNNKKYRLCLWMRKGDSIFSLLGKR